MQVGGAIKQAFIKRSMMMQCQWIYITIHDLYVKSTNIELISLSLHQPVLQTKRSNHAGVGELP